MGTFGEAYPPFEPLNLLQVNGFEHAHNEYLEIALESGLAGVTLVALFLIWAAAASVRVWRAAAAAPLPAAAAVGVWVMLLHAALDFSLRTLTDACLLGLLCGILASAGSPGAPRRASAPG
jgi:O-antigen ligase